jgi:6-phosphogluconolactonase
MMRTVFLAGIMTAVSLLSAAQAPGRLVFVGTYTGTDSKGIYAFRFDDRAGTLAPVGLVAETQNPSFLTARADGKVLFAVNENSARADKAGSVTSFAVDGATGKLTQLSTQSSRGADPCHLMLDRTGRFLAVANYTGGSFAVLPVGADGRLGPATTVLMSEGSGPDRDRQAGPHAHEAVFDASNRFLLGVDLGLDRVHVYRFDPATGAATPNAPAFAAAAPGSGPRHIVFHPNGRLVFAINELSSTIATYTWDRATGTLAPTGASVSTVPAAGAAGNSTAEIAIHPSGQFLYGSNRGHDSIAVYHVSTTGELTLVEQQPTRGQTPRNFALDPTGKWLIAANQKSGTLAVFGIDPKTGALAPVGPLANVGSPVSLEFLK